MYIYICRTSCRKSLPALILRQSTFRSNSLSWYLVMDSPSTSMRWPGSVKMRFAFHIELGYTIVDLDIRYFAIHGYTVYVCGHQTAQCGHRSVCAVTELPCAVPDPHVRSPNCPVRSPIRVCGHQTALCGHRSACAVTDPPMLYSKNYFQPKL